VAARGRSDPAPIKTLSRIDGQLNVRVGEPVEVVEIAYGGQRGIGAVEVRADAGQSWLPARVKHPNLPTVWTRWVIPLTSLVPGSTRLIVRATDGRGAVQTSGYTAPFPDGSSGWHGIDVHVR
jgi:hypothetical protein